MRLTLWLVTTIGAQTIYSLVVAKSAQRAKDFAKGIGYHHVDYICETDSYNEEKLIRYI